MSDDATGSGEGQAPQSDGSAGDILNVTPVMKEGGEADIAPQGDAPKAEGGETPKAEGGDSWASKFEGEDLGWLQNRGVHDKTPEEALANLVKGFRNAEKRLGVPADRLIQLPSDPTSEGAMDDVHKALGRPDDASGYEITPEEGDERSEGFVSAFTETAHSLGLSKDQAEGVYASLDKYFEDNFAKEEEASATERKAAWEGLKEEWGDTYNYNVQLAKEFAQKVNAPADLVNILGDAAGDAGHVKIIKFFNQLAQQSGVEAPFDIGDDSLIGLGATTPEAAQQRISEMKADPKIRQLLIANNPDNAEVKRYNRLVALAAR